jgi:hypothetical protein
MLQTAEGLFAAGIWGLDDTFLESFAASASLAVFAATICSDPLLHLAPL